MPRTPATAATEEPAPKGEEPHLFRLPGRPADVAGGSRAPGPVVWVDAEVLRDLEEQLAGPAVVQRFIHDYVSLWPRRHETLADAIERQDAEAALDAAISLKVSSSMVGGTPLAHLAQTLQETIQAGNFPAGGELLTAVGVCGRATVNELVAGHARPGAIRSATPHGEPAPRFRRPASPRSGSAAHGDGTAS
ncbi:Hpt domain-containing protein [Arthrobacter sp. NPDC057013]|uniref:Hpt domain-containing protein n=1 Tax=Arthrobacter sp. NPDC057013 TaxID=3345999 RepID=UPI00363F786A